MILVWTFWLLLLAPGAWLHLRLRPSDRPASGFETIAVGYALSFLSLLPLSAVGYALRAPVWVLSACIALGVVAALVALARELRAKRIQPSIAWPFVPAAVLIAFLLVQAAARGGHITNDADFHLARIRFLFDHGLSNADPMTGSGFSHPYHTNIFHAVVAAGARITGLDPILFWQGTLPWAKLVAASSVAVLCLRLGGSALGAWTVCLLQLGAQLNIDWVLYPNQLAPLWLAAVGLGSCIGVFSTPHLRFHALLVGACALLLGVMHGLYAGFFALLGGLVFGALSVQRALSQRAWREPLRLLLIGALLLSLPAPAIYIARYAFKPEQANFDYQGGEPTPRKSKADRWTKTLKNDAAGRFHLPLRRMLGGQPEQISALLALFVLLARRRWVELLGVSTALGACLLFLHVPWLADAAVRKLGSAWMLERLRAIEMMQWLGLVGAGLVPELPAKRALAAVASALPLGAATCAAILAAGGLSAEARLALRRSLDDVFHLQVVSAELLEPALSEQRLMRRIPKGSLVLTHPLAARQLRKYHDVFFLRASRNHTGVDDMLDRTVAISTLMYAKGQTKEVRRLLAKYRIRYALQKKAHPIRWLSGQVEIEKTPTLELIQFRATKGKK